MKRVSLEYCKFILEKVSFDEYLFEKELNKAIKMLAETDLKDFIDWVRKRFSNHKVISKLQYS
ncbi:MAG TPA: hypothetical protein VD905_07605 [Flavobacteriales bacterium]|nr:hypothetical protein [Flavobacteriales bacterium]